MNTVDRISRHVSIMRKNYEELPSPPFLTLFINSICNMKCDHCFYWQSLNQKTDLTKDELFNLSRSLGRLENMYLSGGEPFIRKEFAEICRQFIQHNRVRQMYVTTNGYFTDKTIAALTNVLEEPSLEQFIVEISLDGTPAYHDEFRHAKNAFKKAMETYDALVELQKKDARLRIHSVSTATHQNMAEIKKLTTYLYDRCPKMDHHNLGLIRGDRKDPTLQGPGLKGYQELYEYIRRLWAPREQSRQGAIVEPMMHYTKVRTVQEERQVVACTAGKLSAVVYANGDVTVCEARKPLGNLRKQSFWDIWSSAEATTVRQSIAKKECHCTGEIAMWTSIAFRPVDLVQIMVGSRAWKRARPLNANERVTVDFTAETPSAAPEATTEAEMGLTDEAGNGAERPGLIQIATPAKSK
jgi:MoaA/NifB/PqqE/SkfB family radical SAM enzyme